MSAIGWLVLPALTGGCRGGNGFRTRGPPVVT
jgi:hypothetical protein